MFRARIFDKNLVSGAQASHRVDSAGSMSVPMMKIWEMRVVVDERRVPVRVRVWFSRGL